MSRVALMRASQQNQQIYNKKPPSILALLPGNQATMAY